MLVRPSLRSRHAYKDVTRIDDNGDAVKGGAWLIELQAPIDVAGLLLSHEPGHVTAATQAAVGVLEGSVVDLAPAGATSAPSETTRVGQGGEPPDERETVTRLRGEVAAALEQYGIDVESFKGKPAESMRPALESLMKTILARLP